MQYIRNTMLKHNLLVMFVLEQNRLLSLCYTLVCDIKTTSIQSKYHGHKLTNKKVKKKINVMTSLIIEYFLSKLNLGYQQQHVILILINGGR